jgi:hypothetical protein
MDDDHSLQRGTSGQTFAHPDFVWEAGRVLVSQCEVSPVKIVNGFAQSAH